MSDVRSYLMFLLLLPYSSGVWYCNTPLNCCWALPPHGCISVMSGLIWVRQTMKQLTCVQFYEEGGNTQREKR